MDVRIIVNGIEKEYQGKTISYEDVVKLAGFAPGIILSVTYRSKRNGDTRREGILSPGKEINLEADMLFNVVHTGNA